MRRLSWICVLIFITGPVQPTPVMSWLPVVSETHLLCSIHSRRVVISVGTEWDPGKWHFSVSPDLIFAYGGYSPNDWLELGLSGHAFNGFYIGIDGKIDVIGIFTNDLPVSLFVLGGLAFVPYSQLLILWPCHAGAAVVFRAAEFLDLYACATVTFETHGAYQIGLNLQTFDWLSISANLKIGVNSGKVNAFYPRYAYMFSIAPRFSFSF